MTSQQQSSFIESAKRVVAIEQAAIAALGERFDERFVKACELLKDCQGKVVVCGMGKSGHVGNKIAATLASTANQDRSHAADILRAAYRQVFGNRYLMKLDVQPSIEALFINGDLTVQGLVTALAQSDTYRRLYLEENSPYRFVELNFKHLMGRPPRESRIKVFSLQGRRGCWGGGC